MNLRFRMGLLFWMVAIARGAGAAGEQAPVAVRRTGLDGTWQMACTEPGQGNSFGYQAPASPKGEWVPCLVPGTVQSALLEAGKIADPYFAKNSLDLLWIEQKEWWFRKQFSVTIRPGSRYRLEFDGVDHYATVYLNGKELGKHTGMFAPFSYDVTEVLTGDLPNVVCVKIDPPPQVDKADQELKSQVYYCSQSLHMAWAYVHMLTVGIWKSVRLVETPVAEIRHPFVRTLDCSPEVAHLRLSGEVAGASVPRDARLKMEIEGANCHAGAQAFEAALEFTPDSGGRFDVTVAVRSPCLWWPNGLGAQNLYYARLRLVDGTGTALDELQVRFGIRTIKTVHTPGSPPEWYDWTFCVNDKPFFVRGANWIPPVDLLLRPMPDKARHMVWMARQAGMNLFRIWGGGPTESEEFYDLCDEYGILTQEESPLGIPGIEYQVDPGHYRDVVTGQVLATRNHPSLAIYCGGNEWDPRLPKNKALVDILEQVTTALDGTRVFRPVSPWGGDDHDYSPGASDRYSFSNDVGENYTIFNRNPTPFMSEAGTVCAPCYATLKKFIPDRELKGWPPDRDSAFMHHMIYNWRSFRDSLIKYAEEYGDVQNYEELVPQSMLVAARMDGYLIGHLRADWPRKTGITYWEMKDAWPAVSNGSVDYYGVPKTLYYFVKRAYAPTAIFSRFASNVWWPGSVFGADIFVVSDREDLKGYTVLAEIYDARLRRLASKVFPAEAKADTSLHVGRFEWPVPPGREFPFLYVVTLKKPDGTSVASEPYWLNLAALNGYATPERDHIRFQLGDPEGKNAVKCAGQEIKFPNVIGHMGVSHDGLALLIAAAGTQGWNQTEVTAYYRSEGVEEVRCVVPDWWDNGGWVSRKLGQGIRFSHHLDARKAISPVPVSLHVAYVPFNESALLDKIALPNPPKGQGAYFVFAAAVKHDKQWKALDLSKLYNCDVVGRAGVPESADLLGGTAFDEAEWKREVVVPAPDAPRTRLMDMLPKTRLAGELFGLPDGSARLRMKNAGEFPAFLAEVDVGEAALGQLIPSDNYFWLAPGETREVLIEKSPAAKLDIDKAAIRLRAWNAVPTPL